MRAVGIAVTLATLASASPVAAEEPGRARAEDERVQLAAEVYRASFDPLGAGYGDSPMWAATVAADVRVIERLAVSASWGAVHLGELDDESAGNPVLGVHADVMPSLRVGVEVALPVASTEPDRPLHGAGLEGAAGARGNWDGWAWYPDWMAVVAPVRWRWRDRATEIEVTGAAGVAWEVSGEHPAPTSALVAQLGVDARRWLMPALAIEGRIAATTIRNDRDADDSGVAELGAAYAFGAGTAYARLGLPFDLEAVGTPITLLVGVRRGWP